MSIGSAIFAQLTLQFPYTLKWAATPPPKKNAPSLGVCTHPIRGSLGPTKSASQMASRSVQPFLQGSVSQSERNRQTDLATCVWQHAAIAS